MKRIFFILLSLGGVLSSLDTGPQLLANTISQVTQVIDEVTISEDVDYVISSTTPFSDEGVVNITNTEHAVVIIRDIRPSKVISSWLKNHVKINGVQAVNGSNCQVRMYAQGAIIFPYTKDIKPLTVYSEQQYEGSSCNDFGLENSGGFMNTLSEEKLNNQIRSFKLKRGYMVTFSTRAEGRGYSRCFIADQEDLEVPTLPFVLDQHISSYRVFQWFNAPKKGLGSDTRADANALVNSSWCYDWAVGQDLLPDVECVPNHIYEDWPSASACGSVTYSCHMKTNNEPGNSADDHPQTVDQVLANWENLMRTGMRLCSESSHDGSMGHLKAFIDSIDARGWRCDILDLHCYWRADQFNDGNLTWYSDNYGKGRPIWISEWVWGASWNNNGAFAVSNRDDFEGNFNNTYNGTKPILDVLNKHSRIERYAYWNSEANCSKIFNGSMKRSTLGDYYANMTPGLGYNKNNEFIPTNPRQYDPSNLSGNYDKTNHLVTLKWHDENGEYNRSMTIQVKTPNTSSWKDVQTVKPKDGPADYEVSVEGRDSYKYRVQIKDLMNKARQTNEITAVIENVEAGDDITIGQSTKYLGGNMLLNGSFDLGLLDWQNGQGQPLAAPYYQAVSRGGVNDGPYLQCYGSSDDAKNIASIYKKISLATGSSYYVAGASCNNPGKTQKFISTYDESVDLLSRLAFSATTEWNSMGASFTCSNDTILMIKLRGLAGKSQFDELRVARLFDTQEEALADAL